MATEMLGCYKLEVGLKVGVAASINLVVAKYITKHPTSDYLHANNYLTQILCRADIEKLWLKYINSYKNN